MNPHHCLDCYGVQILDTLLPPPNPARPRLGRRLRQPRRIAQVAPDQPNQVSAPGHPAQGGGRVHRVFQLGGDRERQDDVGAFGGRGLLGDLT